ncbi:MAG: DHHW family protein [Oscillospiraceae bacterium]|nr:DHHW family protein [Oscillospiraceae bacterium]
MSKNKTASTRTAAAREKQLKAITSLVTVLLFFGTLAGLGLATIFSEKESFSETQNRKLADFPKLTGKNIYSGKFTSGTEEYISDHFAGHDGWIAAKTSLEMLTGKRERNDIYILSDRLVEKIPEPDMTEVDKSVNGIIKFAEDNNVVPYVMIVPTQAEIYKNELPPNAPNPDQQAFINGVYSKLEGKAVPVDVYSTLSANKDSYIYYRTDHHWTTRGAFLAYIAAARKMDILPLSEADYDIDHASDSFKGTFYSKVLYEGIEPDSLDIWLPAEGGEEPEVEIYSQFGEAPELHEGMYFREYLDVKDKYSTFFGTNQPMVTIRTGNEGEKLLVFKDSYAHCFVPFMTEHFSEITMVDLRYIQMSYKDIIDVSKYDKVMFLYNASTFMSDRNMKKLMY